MGCRTQRGISQPRLLHCISERRPPPRRPRVELQTWQVASRPAGVLVYIANT